MLGVGFDVIVILVAGALWVIGRVAESAKQFRTSTRRALERQQRKQEVSFQPTPQPDLYASKEPEPSREPPPPPPAPPRRPPRRPRLVAQQAGRVVADSRREEAPAPRRAFLVRLRADREKMREAIVLREILGPPVALRHRRRRW